MDFSEDIDILAIAGSIREGSYCQCLVEDAAKVAEKMGVKVAIVRLDDYEIPIYSDAIEKKKGLPEKVKKLRSLIASHQALIIVTPEYNGSLPPLLKNVLDWTSRDEKADYSSLISDKPVALMSASPGPGGGKRALSHLTDIIHSLDGKTTEAMVSIGTAYKYFAEEDRVNEALESQIKELIQRVQHDKCCPANS